jgi:hypothetical protein
MEVSSCVRGNTAAHSQGFPEGLKPGSRGQFVRAGGFVRQNQKLGKRHAGAFGSNDPDTFREENTSKGVKKPRSAAGMK